MQKSRPYKLPRTGLNANPRDSRCSNFVQVGGEVLAHRGFFVPILSVRRQIIADEAAVDFHKNLSDFCRKKPYEPRDLGRIGISLVEKARFRGCFLRADVQPDAGDMLVLATNVRDALASCVKSKPRSLTIPVGSVNVFGNQSNKLAFCVDGWKGFDSRYATRNTDRTVNANHQLTREMSAVTGEITQFFDEGYNSHGEFVDVSMRAIERQTPHVTFAQKSSAAREIGNNERADLSGQILAFAPDELKFFDPVIHLDLVTDKQYKTAYTNNESDFTTLSSGLYVRKPHLQDDSIIGQSTEDNGTLALVAFT